MGQVMKKFSNLKVLKFNGNKMRNRFLLIGLFLALLSNVSYGQNQSIYGKVTDDSNKPLPFAAVKLYKGGQLIEGMLTDKNGNYKLELQDPGTYDSLVIVKKEYSKFKANPVIVRSTQRYPQDAKLEFGKSIEVIFTGSKVLINSSETGKTMDRESFMHSAAQNIGEIVAATATVTNTADGLSVKGGKSSSNIIYVDGVPTSSYNLPKDAIEEINVITGGIPAEFGDVTGGVINITTRGPSSHLTGGLEARTSQFLDPFGYNYIEGNLSGPLIKSKTDKRPILGYFLTGNLTYAKVNSPPAIDMYRVSDAKLQDLINNPIAPSPTGTGYIPTTYFVTKDDMVKTRVKPNSNSLNYVLNGKLVYEPVKNTVITIGANNEHANRNAYSFANNMFNFDLNPQVTSNVLKTYVRFTQRFIGDTNSPVKSISYSIQGNYTRSNSTVQDPTLKDNLFAYGYIGSFKRNYVPFYSQATHNIDGKSVTAYYFQGYSENGLTFSPGGYNPVLESYDKKFFELTGDQTKTFNDVFSNGGLVNGQGPSNVNSLWSGLGARYGAYSQSQSEQYYVNASGTVIINNHHLKAGVQYQQNSSSNYSVGANQSVEGLWTLARQLVNSHLTQLDTLHPHPVFSKNGSFTDTVNYPWLVGAQSTFDKNFRNHLKSIGARDQWGRLIDDQSKINIDQYGPNDMKLSYFSADELLNNANSYVSFYGYDYLGNKLKKKATLSDFLDPSKRWIGAYNPIYTAGYIQDNFQLGDITFNVGVRIDRFDANQKVLQDPYSLYPLRHAGDVTQINNLPVTHPGNIGSDYAVYVDDALNPTKIVGYRKADVWYDAAGTEVADPNTIALKSKSDRIQPYLVARNTSEVQLTDASFKDYTPQVSVLPRVSFTFPISDKAIFYANYDVLTIRPQAGNFTTWDDYYFLQQRATLTIPNPNLKPEKRTNYELGFSQRVGGNSSLTFQAFYGQIRDLVQTRVINQAYPITYTTYDNIDFGTVKGMTFGYNFVRASAGADPHNNPSGINLSANYTLQFADGTGSNEGSGANLVSAGQPNLRTPFPLNYDIRHQVQAIIDYRFGAGKNYRGPSIGKVKLLQGGGINMIFNTSSGAPYSRQSNITSGDNILIGVANRSSLEGTVNGSRLPWQVRMDLKIDRNFFFKTTGLDQFGNKVHVKDSRIYLNAFVYVQNLLDARNIVHVYRYTGLANDDAYLNTTEGQKFAHQTPDYKALVDQYTIKMNNPDNYISPRFIRFGASFNFY